MYTRKIEQNPIANALALGADLAQRNEERDVCLVLVDLLYNLHSSMSLSHCKSG